MSKKEITIKRQIAREVLDDLHIFLSFQAEGFIVPTDITQLFFFEMTVSLSYFAQEEQVAQLETLEQSLLYCGLQESQTYLLKLFRWVEEQLERRYEAKLTPAQYLEFLQKHQAMIDAYNQKNSRE